MKHLILTIFLLLLAFAHISAQPARLTKEQLGERGNALLNAGKQREALDLVDAYPEFADGAEALYIRSIAYTELRDYKTADIYFQKQFDQFCKNGDSARIEAADVLSKDPATASNDLASLMFGAALISYASADLVNSLRATAFEKNGMPTATRRPKNLPGYDEMLIAYKETSIKAALLQITTNELKEALKNTNKAVQLGPKDPEAYLARAQVYRKMKKVALARADELKAGRLTAK
jgi:tetratricopeptide (TPR) repeat protein